MTREGDGRWLASIPSVRGCHTYGRSIAQARQRIREALSLFVDDAEEAELIEDVQLPKHAMAALRASHAQRSQADRIRRAAQEATADAARVLVDELRLGMRDAGELLGLSHQRIQQLLRA